jgi:phospholipid/cholesterol/gamma-HCH transport system substrate-binding protein
MSKFYPNQYKTQLKVGIYSLLVIIALVASYLWMTSRLNLKNQQDLRVGFTDVMGLEVGDKIMFRGMEVGRVREIKLKGDKVIVSGKILRELKLLEGCRFLIGDSSLMGGTVMSIIQGSGPKEVSMAGYLTGEEPSGIMAVMSKASGAIDELSTILAELKAEDGVLERSRNLLGNADNAVNNVDRLAVELKSDISRSLDRIDHLTTGINQVVENNDQNIEQILRDTPRAMANVNTTLDSLQVLSAKLSQTVEAVNNGSGTAGRLVNDQELYNRMLSSLNNLEQLIADIKQNPRRYIKFSLF